MLQSCAPTNKLAQPSHGVLRFVANAQEYATRCPHPPLVRPLCLVPAAFLIKFGLLHSSPPPTPAHPTPLVHLFVGHFVTGVVFWGDDCRR